MKNFNVPLAMIGMLILSQTVYGAADDKNKILMGLISNHTRTFGVNDLFKDRIDFNYWNQTMKGVQTFITQTAQGDSKLTNELNVILRANDELVNNIKIAYNGLFAPGGKMQPTLVTNILTSLKGIESQMKKSESSLKGTTFFYQNKKDAREILVALAGFIGASAQAAYNNLKRRTES